MSKHSARARAAARRQPPKPPRRTATGAFPDFGPWNESERCIYHFHDGSRWREVDPLRVQVLLYEDPEFDHNLKLATLTVEHPGAQAQARQAFLSLTATIRRSFGVEEFNTDEASRRRGLTDAECLALLSHYSQFMGELKKKAGIADSLTPPSAAASAASAGPSATPSTSASSSTANGSRTASPSPSPSPSA